MGVAPKAHTTTGHLGRKEPCSVPQGYDCKVDMIHIFECKITSNFKILQIQFSLFQQMLVHGYHMQKIIIAFRGLSR